MGRDIVPLQTTIGSFGQSSGSIDKGEEGKGEFFDKFGIDESEKMLLCLILKNLEEGQ